MPLYCLALRRLNAASRSSEPSRSAGSKPSKLSTGTGAWASTSRARATISGRYSGRFEALGDGQVGDRAGPQHRAVGLLAPQVAEHVAGGLGVGQQLGQLAHPRGDLAAGQLADVERRPRCPA